MNLTFSLHLAVDFSVYGDTIFNIVQNLIIMVLIWAYSPQIGILEKGLVSVAVLGLFTVLVQDSGISEETWALIASSSMALNICSKVPQIYQNFSSKSTGQLAFATFLLGWLGSLARLGTVLVASDDFVYQMQFMVGLGLNTILMAQFLMYWNESATKNKTVPEKKDTKKTQ